VEGQGGMARWDERGVLFANDGDHATFVSAEDVFAWGGDFVDPLGIVGGIFELL